VRYRDIKLNADLRRLHNMVDPDPAAVELEKQLKAMKRQRKARARHQRTIMALPDPEQWPQPPPGGMKRGPKPKPFLDKCDQGWVTQLNKRETTALKALWRRQAPHVTKSTFLRSIVCRYLEDHRRKDCLTQPFAVDLTADDPRRRRLTRQTRSVAA
jgi:hypothetical protein